MSDTFDNVADALAGFGLSLIERTRLTFGAPALKLLSQVPAGGKVYVACKGGDSLLTLPSKLSVEANKSVRVLDATTNEYDKVRAHVSMYAKSRKVPVTISTIRNADNVATAFTVTRKAS